MAKKRVHRVREARPEYGDREEAVSATDFKTHCLELIDRIQRTRGEVVVTRYGKPVARLVPVEREGPSAVGCLRGGVLDMGDLVAATGERWDADA